MFRLHSFTTNLLNQTGKKLRLDFQVLWPAVQYVFPECRTAFGSDVFIKRLIAGESRAREDCSGSASHRAERRIKKHLVLSPESHYRCQETLESARRGQLLNPFLLEAHARTHTPTHTHIHTLSLCSLSLSHTNTNTCSAPFPILP